MNGPTLSAAALLLGAIALAGCFENVQDFAADANLEFKGTGTGSHSQKAKCDDQGRVSGSGDITDGTVTLRVTSDGGEQAFQRTFEGKFDLASTTIQGDSGEWTIEATRMGDDLVGDTFAGEYRFSLGC